MATPVKVKVGTESETSNEKQAGVALGEAEAVELGGRRRFFQMRTTWSRWIIGWITALIAFNMLLTLAVGAKWLNFLEYQWFITAVIVETFLQIVGMGFVAVRFLFSDGKDKS